MLQFMRVGQARGACITEMHPFPKSQGPRFKLCSSSVTDSPEFGEPGVGYRITGRFQLLDKLGFALGGIVG